MTTFSSRNQSIARVPVARDEIWDVLSNPATLARLTPLIDDITAAGTKWCWRLAGISALGISIAPSFTERMTMQPPSRIMFAHEPPPGKSERAGANGVYELTELAPDRTKLMIDITLCAELPLPAFSRRAVEKTMAVTMQRTGDAFAARLYDELDIDPADVEVEVLHGAGAP